MNKLAMAIAAAAIIGFAGAASADHNENHNPPGKAVGVYGCEGFDEEFENPGKAVQFGREAGFNPKEAAEIKLGGPDNPGQAIKEFCGNPVFEPGAPE